MSTKNRRKIDNNGEAIPFHITEYVNSKTYNIYLNEEIIEAEHYSALFHLLRSVGEYDIVKFYINSPGGNLFTGVQLISCMKQSMAHIVTILDGQAMSLAPLILFAGDDIQISENSLIMFHHYSSWGGGKGNEQLSNAKAMNEFYKNTLIKYGKPFLNDNEIEQIIDGKDLYFGDDIINERIDSITESYEDDEAEDCKQEEAPECPSSGQINLDFGSDDIVTNTDADSGEYTLTK